MGSIYEDIVEDINIAKPTATKLILKWTVRIAAALITVAFTYGQIKGSRVNRLSDIEDGLNANTKAVIEMRQEMKSSIDALNGKIDKVYDDGFKAFNDFQQYNDKKLGMIIDYGSKDKEMLKRMLEIMTLEKTKTVENGVQQAKITPATPIPLNRNDSISIVVKQIKNEK